MVLHLLLCKFHLNQRCLVLSLVQCVLIVITWKLVQRQVWLLVKVNHIVGFWPRLWKLPFFKWNLIIDKKTFGSIWENFDFLTKSIFDHIFGFHLIGSNSLKGLSFGFRFVWFTCDARNLEKVNEVTTLNTSQTWLFDWSYSMVILLIFSVQTQSN